MYDNETVILNLFGFQGTLAVWDTSEDYSNLGSLLCWNSRIFNLFLKHFESVVRQCDHQMVSRNTRPLPRYSVYCCGNEIRFSRKCRNRKRRSCGFGRSKKVGERAWREIYGVLFVHRKGSTRVIWRGIQKWIGTNKNENRLSKRRKKGM